jgi:ribosome-binding factor A
MSFNKKNFIQQRKQSLYEREISRILYEMVQEYNLPSLSLSYCELSTRGESVKVYLSFRREENHLETLNLINKKYSPLIKKELARSKKFSSLPHLIFLPDEE